MFISCSISKVWNRPSVKPSFSASRRLAHRTVDRVVVERVLDLTQLHAETKPTATVPAPRHQRDLAGDGVAMIRRDRDPLQRDKRLDPFRGPGAIAVDDSSESGQKVSCGLFRAPALPIS